MLEKCRRWLKKEYWLPRLKRVLAFCLNPRLLLCLGIGWFLTNGWAYVAAALGTALHLPWLAGAGGAESSCRGGVARGRCGRRTGALARRGRRPAVPPQCTRV